MAGKVKIKSSDPTLFPIEEIDEKEKWILSNFSASGFCPDDERRKLENKYAPIMCVTDKFNRQSVSYQLSKKDSIHRWLKYREGFSAELVRILLNEFEIKPGDWVVDPFMGSGTTALAACMLGINSIGWDILPMSKLSIDAKTALYKYDLTELRNVIRMVEDIKVPPKYKKRTPEISITSEGYPDQTAIDLAYYADFFEKTDLSPIAKNLVKLCTLNTLESISYSIKSGQYLSWDQRCPRIIKANELRISQGRRPFVNKIDKGNLPTLKEALLVELSHVFEDISSLQQLGTHFEAECVYNEGSVLFEISKVKSNSIDAVITSPPYCNRYDYTRTYALELAYLGKSTSDVTALRQELLSCTVESKTKLERLEDHYSKIGRLKDFNKVISIIEGNPALNESISALKMRAENGEVNNKGIIRMVEGYFTELTFLYAELYRIAKKGAHIAFVNDNVRYAGEVIPVDFLCTELAETIGFKPVSVYSLKQQKGNSSQQMAKYGRVALRKSITVWEK